MASKVKAATPADVPTWQMKFLGLSFSNYEPKTTGRKFRVRVSGETKGTAIMNAMNVAERVSRFFQERIEIAILISVQQFTPELGEELFIPIPDDWKVAYEVAEQSSYIFDEKGKPIDESEKETAPADDRPNRQDAGERKTQRRKVSKSNGQPKKPSKTGGKGSTGGGRSTRSNSGVGVRVRQRKQKKIE